MGGSHITAQIRLFTQQFGNHCCCKFVKHLFTECTQLNVSSIVHKPIMVVNRRFNIGVSGERIHIFFTHRNHTLKNSDSRTAEKFLSNLRLTNNVIGENCSCFIFFEYCGNSEDADTNNLNLSNFPNTVWKIAEFNNYRYSCFPSR